jgi:hypothetical protein
MRRERKHHYIYKTTCKVNGKFYVGMHSTDNLEDGYLGSGKRLWHSIRKHGKENHSKEILEFLPNRSSLKDREKEIVNEQFLEDPLCMNLQIGGGGGCTPESQFNRSSAGGKASWHKNRELHLEIVKKGGNSTKERNAGIFSEHNPRNTGKQHSEAHKKKIGVANAIKQKGPRNSQYGTCWITKGGLNKKIKKEELESYVSLGWAHGRTSSISFSEKMKTSAKKGWETRK